MDEKMRMLGHEYVSDHAKGVLGSRGDDRVGQPLPRAIPGKKWLAVEAGKSEVVKIVWGIAALAALAGGSGVWVPRHVCRFYPA